MTYITAPQSIDNTGPSKKKYAARHRPDHPLASSTGYVNLNRLVLYEKLNGEPGDCHWCSIPLTWPTTVADHLDDDSLNDVPENLVASCRGCNGLRSHGGRSKPKTCAWCGVSFVAKEGHNKPTRRFCSRACWDAQHASNPPPHGTPSRYSNQGCRCDLCREGQRLHGIEYRARRRARGLR